jgi:hypothetical protein
MVLESVGMLGEGGCITHYIERGAIRPRMFVRVWWASSLGKEVTASLTYVCIDKFMCARLCKYLCVGSVCISRRTLQQGL